jgi:hypothetical protein
MLVYRRGVGAADYEIAKVDTTGKGKPVDVSNDPNALDVSPSWRTSTASFRTPASARRPAILGVWNFFCDAAYTGTAANDFYTGTTSWNHMCGAGGSDTISGCGSPFGTADFIRGDAGTDHLYGYIAPKAICLVAADRTDWLKSRYAGPVAADKDYLYGGPGSDHALIDANDVAAADIEDVQT